MHVVVDWNRSPSKFVKGETVMKKIEAIVRPEKLDAVVTALEKAGYPGIMITEIEGHGRQKGIKQQWRGEEFQVNFLPKMKVEIVVNDHEAENILHAIIEASSTGGVGDGKIFVSPVEEAIRIRTRERGTRAIA